MLGPLTLPWSGPNRDKFGTPGTLNLNPAACPLLSFEKGSSVGLRKVITPSLTLFRRNDGSAILPTPLSHDEEYWDHKQPVFPHAPARCPIEKVAYHWDIPIRVWNKLMKALHGNTPPNGPVDAVGTDGTRRV